jgi:SAM (Sterile alpha motif) domain-containing protein/adenylate/guanylate cyclase family protein
MYAIRAAGKGAAAWLGCCRSVLFQICCRAAARKFDQAVVNRQGIAMQRIEDWLLQLGMSEYAQRFAENDIDISVLRHLTDQDLKELGVSLGHRRKMLAAIVELAGALQVSPEPTLTGSKPQDTAPRSIGERRQLTVLFCDLVGSTALSTQFDPEDLREIIGVYHRCVAEAVAELDGFVAKYMGDGVLIYFGYPSAHEDDAERAVRAGLSLIERAGWLEAPVQLKVRVGIARHRR